MGTEIVRIEIWKNKREQPETTVEPKGKTGRPKIKYTDTIADAEKRDASTPEDEPKNRKKRRNKKKDKALPAITAHDADDEGDSEETSKKQRKPLIPSKIGFQKLYENLPMLKIRIQSVKQNLRNSTLYLWNIDRQRVKKNQNTQIKQRNYT